MTSWTSNPSARQSWPQFSCERKSSLRRASNKWIFVNWMRTCSLGIKRVAQETADGNCMIKRTSGFMETSCLQFLKNRRDCTSWARIVPSLKPSFSPTSATSRRSCRGAWLARFNIFCGGGRGLGFDCTNLFGERSAKELVLKQRASAHRASGLPREAGLESVA